MFNKLPNTLFVGKSVIYLPTCHSTNEVASSFLQKPGIFEGTLVITSNQTAGKGQRGNSWESESYKNLTFSLILHPQFINVTRQFNLNIAISLAVFDFLTIYLGRKVKIKWPNDIYVEDESGDKKICGILIQNTVRSESLEYSVVGIGVNINQRNFGEGRAVSLSNITNQEYDLEGLVRQLMEKIEARYLSLKEGRITELEAAYLNKLYWFNEEHLFKSEKGHFQGKIVGLDELGRLKILSNGEELAFSFKEVEFVE